MPNNWTDQKSFEVIEATPYPVKGYGYLYVFECVRRSKKGAHHFFQMSQIFTRRKVSLGPNNTYTHIKNLGPNALTSLNRGQERDEKWGIQQAKDIVDRKEDNNSKWEGVAKTESEKDQYVSREVADRMLQEKRNQWADEDARKDNNWYNKAKTFVRNIITSNKK